MSMILEEKLQMKGIKAKQIITAGVLLMLQAGAGCSSLETPPQFDPKTCLEEPPTPVEGMQVIHGPRTPQSVLADMRFVSCNGQVLFKQLNERGEPLVPGEVVFRVQVEYTGEVIAAEVIESTIVSRKFERRLSDMIMDTDFSPWQRHDEDAVFVYPMRFSRWWE